MILNAFFESYYCILAKQFKDSSSTSTTTISRGFRLCESHHILVLVEGVAIDITIEFFPWKPSQQSIMHAFIPISTISSLVGYRGGRLTLFVARNEQLLHHIRIDVLHCTSIRICLVRTDPPPAYRRFCCISKRRRCIGEDWSSDPQTLCCLHQTVRC